MGCSHKDGGRSETKGMMHSVLMAAAAQRWGRQARVLQMCGGTGGGDGGSMAYACLSPVSSPLLCLTARFQAAAATTSMVTLQCIALEAHALQLVLVACLLMSASPLFLPPGFSGCTALSSHLDTLKALPQGMPLGCLTAQQTFLPHVAARGRRRQSHRSLVCRRRSSGSSGSRRTRKCGRCGIAVQSVGRRESVGQVSQHNGM